MQVSFSIRKDKISIKTGKCPIYVTVTYNGGRIRKSIKHHCLAKDFDETKQKVKSSDKNSGNINSAISEINSKLQSYFSDTILERSQVSENALLTILSNLGLQDSKEHDTEDVKPKKLKEAFSLFVKKNLGLKSNSYLRTYNQISYHLELYKPNTLISDANYSFWLGFVQYCYNEAELEQNTVYTHIKRIKTLQSFITNLGGFVATSTYFCVAQILIF
jgi:hypothetical protein